MRNRITLSFLAVLAMGPSALVAHHGTAVYDIANPVTVKGTVTAWSWTNPHCLLEFDAKDDKGNVVHWVAETSNPSDMTVKGWSRHTFKPGDEVTVRLIAAKNGRPVGRIQYVILNGQGLGADKAPPTATTNEPKP